jgi:hypothetical protein
MVMVKQHFSWGSQRFASSTNADWHHKTHEEVMWAMVNGQAGTGTTTTTTTTTTTAAAAAASLLSDQKYLIMHASSVSHRIGDILSQAKDISPQLLYKLMTTSYLKKFLLYSKFIVLMLDQYPAVRAIYPEFGDLSHLRLFYDQSIFLTSPSWLALQHQCVKTAKTAKATNANKDASNIVAFGTFTYLFQRLRGLFMQVLLLPLLSHYGHNVVATPLRSEPHRLQWEQVGDDPTFHFEAEHYDRLAQLPPPLLQTLCQALKHFITQDSTCGWLWLVVVVGWLGG